MADVDWTGDTAIRLVEEYRQRPELWDSRNELYRVQTAKYEAWSEMARIFECDIADLRKKLNSVFASHRREKAKIRNGGRSTWFLYPYLSFLPNHLEKPAYPEVIVGTAHDSQISHSEFSHSQISNANNEKSNHSSEDDDDDHDDDDDDDDDKEETEIIIKQEPVVETYCIRETSPRQAKKILSKKRLCEPLRKNRLTRPLLKRKIIKDNNQSDTLDNRLLETLRLLRKSDLSRKKDECDSFGEYIAISLRKHDERTQSMIKQAINNILFEQEMKKYSTGQYTVMISGVDENPLVLADTEEK